MLNSFGKFCRKLRIDNGELMKDMAKKLGVTSSYLSAVENGKRNVPQDWLTKITNLYSLSIEEQAELKQAEQDSKTIIKIDFENYSNEDKNILMALARELNDLDEGDRNKIKNILFKNKQ